MFKTGITNSMYNFFLKSFKSNQLNSTDSRNESRPYVYADSMGIKLIAEVMDDGKISSENAYAITVVEEGNMEVLFFD